MRANLILFAVIMAVFASSAHAQQCTTAESQGFCRSVSMGCFGSQAGFEPGLCPGSADYQCCTGRSFRHFFDHAGIVSDEGEKQIDGVLAGLEQDTDIRIVLQTEGAQPPQGWIKFLNTTFTAYGMKEEGNPRYNMLFVFSMDPAEKKPKWNGYYLYCGYQFQKIKDSILNSEANREKLDNLEYEDGLVAIARDLNNYMRSNERGLICIDPLLAEASMKAVTEGELAANNMNWLEGHYKVCKAYEEFASKSAEFKKIQDISPGKAAEIISGACNELYRTKVLNLLNEERGRIYKAIDAADKIALFPGRPECEDALRGSLACEVQNIDGVVSYNLVQCNAIAVSKTKEGDEIPLSGSEWQIVRKFSDGSGGGRTGCLAACRQSQACLAQFRNFDNVDFIASSYGTENIASYIETLVKKSVLKDELDGLREIINCYGGKKMSISRIMADPLSCTEEQGGDVTNYGNSMTISVKSSPRAASVRNSFENLPLLHILASLENKELNEDDVDRQLCASASSVAWKFRDKFMSTLQVRQESFDRLSLINAWQLTIYYCKLSRHEGDLQAVAYAENEITNLRMGDSATATFDAIKGLVHPTNLKILAIMYGATLTLEYSLPALTASVGAQAVTMHVFRSLSAGYFAVQSAYGMDEAMAECARPDVSIDSASCGTVMVNAAFLLSLSHPIAKDLSRIPGIKEAAAVMEERIPEQIAASRANAEYIQKIVDGLDSEINALQEAGNGFEQDPYYKVLVEKRRILQDRGMELYTAADAYENMEKLDNFEKTMLLAAEMLKNGKATPLAASRSVEAQLLEKLSLQMPLRENERAFVRQLLRNREKTIEEIKNDIRKEALNTKKVGEEGFSQKRIDSLTGDYLDVEIAGKITLSKSVESADSQMIIESLAGKDQLVYVRQALSNLEMPENMLEMQDLKIEVSFLGHGSYRNAYLVKVTIAGIEGKFVLKIPHANSIRADYDVLKRLEGWNVAQKTLTNEPVFIGDNVIMYEEYIPGYAMDKMFERLGIEVDYRPDDALQLEGQPKTTQIFYIGELRKLFPDYEGFQWLPQDLSVLQEWEIGEVMIRFNKDFMVAKGELDGRMHEATVEIRDGQTYSLANADSHAGNIKIFIKDGKIEMRYVDFFGHDRVKSYEEHIMPYLTVFFYNTGNTLPTSMYGYYLQGLAKHLGSRENAAKILLEVRDHYSLLDRNQPNPLAAERARAVDVFLQQENMIPEHETQPLD